METLRSRYKRGNYCHTVSLNFCKRDVKPKLERELRDGARIVSHEFRIPGWKPSRELDVRDENGLIHKVYLYVKGSHREQ